jgi:hypothetical protein
MTTKNEYHQFDDKELMVLAFLKNLKQYAPSNFDYLIYYGVSASEMIKFIEHPEKYGDFDFGFICGLFDAIHKTYKHYIIKSDLIPTQNEEDKIISSILMNSESAFKSIYINERLINKSHINAYLLREEEIFKWNGWLLLIVQRKVQEIKAEMRLKFEITG